MPELAHIGMSGWSDEADQPDTCRSAPQLWAADRRAERRLRARLDHDRRHAK